MATIAGGDCCMADGTRAQWETATDVQVRDCAACRFHHVPIGKHRAGRPCARILATLAIPFLEQPSRPCPAPPSTPRTLIATVREILDSAKQKKKNLTIDGYARCFKALDTLDTLLGYGDIVETTLKAFKLDLLAEINVSALRTTYASAAAAPPPTASSPATPPPPKNTATKSWEVTIFLNKDSDVLTLLLSDIKSRVEAVIAGAGVKKLKGITLRGMKVLLRGRILVAVDSNRAASLLKQSATHWVPRLANNGSLIVPRC
ncbi:hypothetical protein B0H19DRAFT_1080292 [Mycena capillaripes]|nr:hypothetical protein B0H19DRAFT_1080292 [Mycena capillaripes]